MKNFLLAFTLLFILVSCEDQVKFNNPAVQGLKDNVVWRATLIKAVQAVDGSLTITAYQSNEILTLNTSSTSVKTFPLGVDLTNKATLVVKGTAANTVFSTGIDVGDGQIVITELDIENHTITGEFEFNAVNEATDLSVKPSVNFQKGIFYKVPFTVATK